MKKTGRQVSGDPPLRLCCFFHKSKITLKLKVHFTKQLGIFHSPVSLSGPSRPLCTPVFLLIKQENRTSLEGLREDEMG